MNAVWLCNLEKDLILMKSGKKIPTTAVPQQRPHTSGGCIDERATRDPMEQELRRKESEETWLRWRSKKDKDIREAKLKAKELEMAQNNNDMSTNRDPQVLKTRFKEWKSEKRKQALRQKMEERQRSTEYEKLQEQLLQHRQEKLRFRQQVLETQKSRKRSVKLRKKSIPSSQSAMDTSSIPVRSSHNARLESSGWGPVTKEKPATASVLLTDPLSLLKTSHPSPEIYVLASILYKILSLELRSRAVSLNVWPWLPWKIVRHVFHSNLTASLDQLDVKNIQSATLALIYVHLSIPCSDIRNKTAAALRTWVTNIAGLHGIVDPHTRLLSIDRLAEAGVHSSHLARAYLMTEIYPFVRLKSKRKELEPAYDNDSIVMYNLGSKPSSVPSCISASLTL